jgi:hypothetical protein
VVCITNRLLIFLKSLHLDDVTHQSVLILLSIWTHVGVVTLANTQAGCPNCTVSAGHKHIGLAFAAQWDGPYIDLTPTAPIFPFASEDPCIFMSPSLGTYHVLSHTDATGVAEQPVAWPHVSAHAFAAHPSGPWHVVRASS